MRTAITEQLKGKTVLEAGGQVVGTLDEIVIDTDALALWGIRLRLKREIAKEIGASGGILHGAVLDLPIEMVSAAGDAVILSVPLARLRELEKEKERQAAESRQDAPAADGGSPSSTTPPLNSPPRSG
jgi:sporulation protein YlmC with PRC-barrel domain